MNVDSINSFLDDFKSKMKIWDIIFRDDRGKNFQSLIDLEISSAYRKEILEKLKSEDYSEGPLEDKLNNSTELWVFGKEVKGKEVYIKISIGNFNSPVFCISFHIAEHKMKYPLK
jgi:hypothetical protein